MDKDKFIGTRLDGRYELTELVGEGGMANVYRAMDVLDNRMVAVKILKKEYSESEEFQRRFRNESKAIAVLSHPNIVKIYDMGFSERVQYIVMEYIDGITLKDYIDSERVLNWMDAVHFVIQILRALQHAHNHGIVHRDIKPQNIMLLTDGTIKVMDFGIAKFAREESRTATDQAIGTVHYISPEQARGDVTDAKSDIYSVGVMFYEMLTGCKPFDTDNPVSIAVMHMQNVAERPRNINLNIPSGLEEIIMHAMEKDASKRYQTATDMIQDIEAFKANNQIIFGYYNAPPQPGQTQYFTPPQNNDRNMRGGSGYSDSDDGYYDDYTDEREPERGKSLVVPILMAITIVVVIVAAIVIFMIFSQETDDSNSTTAEVPNVIGMDYDEAVLNYPNVVFDVEEQEYTEKYEVNIIYKQSVDGGTFVKKNDDGKIELAIAVSYGIQKVQIPDLTNYIYEKAEETLEALGVEIEQKKIESTSEQNIEANHVIYTDPEANTEVAVGSTVTIYVSMGIAVDETDVPTFVGMTLEEAEKECEARDLVMEVIEEDSEEEKDVVIAQDPEPGSTVIAGSTISLTASTGEEPEGEVAYGIIDLPSNMSGLYTLSFTEADTGVVLTSYQFVAESLTDGSVTATVTGTGKKSVSVSITSALSGKTGVIGTYTFDFANESFSTTSEDIISALNKIAVETEPAETQVPTTEETTAMEESTADSEEETGEE
ncbi:MAG: Stk1 family PASTA domain-containing Ser/Thr kinase [Ruminococcus sp.]|nr:Stk1 family PASTA domain-containing Ser/Thr kinase [Ruminococcus sp.]